MKKIKVNNYNFFLTFEISNIYNIQLFNFKTRVCRLLQTSFTTNSPLLLQTSAKIKNTALKSYLSTIAKTLC